MYKKLTDGFLILVILSLLFTKEAKAYLDPGSASYILQIILAGFFSVLLFFKNFWKSIFNKLRGRKKEDDSKKK